MNWAIQIISKTLMIKISRVSWGGYDKGFYGIWFTKCLSSISFFVLVHINELYASLTLLFPINPRIEFNSNFFLIDVGLRFFNDEMKAETYYFEKY